MVLESQRYRPQLVQADQALGSGNNYPGFVQNPSGDALWRAWHFTKYCGKKGKRLLVEKQIFYSSSAN